MVDDQKIIQEVLSGKTSSFQILVEKYQRLVAHVVFRMISNSDEREDLCQDVFLKVYSNLDKFRFESKLSTWIARIACNCCINALQKKKAALYDDYTTEGETIENFLDQQSSPSRLAEEKEISERLCIEISQLPPIYRAIITLYHLEDFSYSEIGEILELPDGTVKSYLFRARKMLKEKLIAKYQPEEIK